MANPLTHCKTCAYFQENRPNSPVGTCRFNAPKPSDSGVSHRAVWPEVTWTDWCADGGVRVAITETRVAPKQVNPVGATQTPGGDDGQDPRH